MTGRLVGRGPLLSAGALALLLAGAALVSRAGGPDARADGRPDGGAVGPAECTVAPRDSEFSRIAGVSLVSPRSPLDPDDLTALDRIGAEWVAVLPYGRLDASGAVSFGREGFSSGRIDRTGATIRVARRSGLRVMLKPHLWDGPRWVGDFSPADEAGWTRFESEYREFLLAFADLAQAHDVEIFVIGTELDRTVRERPEFWLALIREVRTRFDGELTYAANWDGVQDIPFWDRLDYIGVDAFFPLSDAATPDPSVLENAWAPVVRELAELCTRHERPVLFTEYGYRSIDRAAGNQWTMPREGASSTPVNLEAQRRAYEALYRSWWNHPWMAGGFLWKWFPGDERLEGRFRADYTPQHKPVEETIRAWYTRR